MTMDMNRVLNFVADVFHVMQCLEPGTSQVYITDLPVRELTYGMLEVRMATRRPDSIHYMGQLQDGRYHEVAVTSKSHTPVCDAQYVDHTTVPND